jgi:hypothetical protein
VGSEKEIQATFEATQMIFLGNGLNLRDWITTGIQIKGTTASVVITKTGEHR